MFYADRNIRPCTILGYTLTTFPKSLIQTKTTKRTLHRIASRKRRRTLQQQQEESLTISGETQEEHGNIPHGLSPLRQYIPAGAEGDEANSSTSTYGEEETVEEELANYFSNPSYRAANPELLEPVNSEEDWGDVSPVHLPP